MIRRSGRSRRAAVDAGAVQAVAVAEMRRVCRLAASGDPEARVQDVPGAAEHPDLVALRHEFNRVLDRTDGFVREAAAALEAAGEGRFHREFLLAGMLGSKQAPRRSTRRGSRCMPARTASARPRPRG